MKDAEWMEILRFINVGRELYARTSDGRKAYVHRDFGGRVRQDETWFCKVIAGSGSATCFAVPVKGLDEYMASHGEEIAEKIWNDHRDETLPYLDEVVSDEIRESMHQKDVQIAALNERIRMLEKGATTKTSPGDAPDSDWLVKVDYNEEDTIECDRLDGVYSLRLSPDLKKMTIVEDDHGTYEAHGGVLYVPYLSRIMRHYRGPMISAFMDGKLVITIDQSLYDMTDDRI